MIRIATENDVEAIVRRECPPWTKPEELRAKWSGYFQEQQAAVRTVGIVGSGSEIFGYGSLLLQSKYPHFAGIPEIHDVWIFEKHRRLGYGRALITWLEEVAREMGYNEIGIGVGLYADYGAAQRLYAQLSFLPDGHGVTYGYQPTVPGKSYPVDDELILWLKKKIIT